MTYTTATATGPGREQARHDTDGPADTTSAGEASSLRTHRADLDALRALAVGFVVLFHMSIGQFQAGFVGVDIFFVLSGFLITGILNAELNETGSVSLTRFWARRTRRLLPASTLVVCTVVIGSIWLTSPIQWDGVIRAAASAQVYASNFFFAAQRDSYFAPDVQLNPLLHYWSLSVEEQFYIVWPLVFYGLGKVRSIRQSVWTKTAVALTLLWASFIYSILTTENAASIAYYSPISRAWEFLAGAVLALAWTKVPKPRSSASRQIVALCGLALIGSSLQLVEAHAGFPAPTALLPVAGTLLFITAGVTDGDIGHRIMSLGPIQYVGRLSYSWYLWHWPFLVIGISLTRSTSILTRSALVLASFVAAVATHHLIENRTRFAPLLQSKRTSFALAAALIVIGFGSIGLLAQRSDGVLEEARIQTLLEAREAWYITETSADDCSISDVNLLVERCRMGDLSAEKTVLLVGDSHAQHWMPALDRLGKQSGFSVVTRVMGGCPTQDLDHPYFIEGERCRALQDNLHAVVAELQPDAVLISQTSGLVDVILDESQRSTDEEGRRQTWIDATVEMLDHLAGTPVGWIDPTPVNEHDPIACLAWRSEAECVADRATAMRTPELARAWTATAIAQSAHSATTVDLTDHLCDDQSCPLIIDDVVVYRDADHLSVKAVEMLAEDLRLLIDQLLDPRPTPS